MEKMLRRLIGEDVNLVTALQPAPGCVRADPTQIQQVVMNLAINARDAMPRGGKLTIETAHIDIEPSEAIERSKLPPGRFVMLAVRDTGCGMSQEVQSHLFEPFFTTKEVGKGTGLGLSTIYGIVKQSGGSIRVSSELGKGSTFEVYLPRLDDVRPPFTEMSPIVSPRVGEEVVFLVEDEDGVRALTRQVLERQGYTVREARNGLQALRLEQENPGPIDLLVTDVIMPEMDGRELAEQMLARRPDLRVLYVSGYTDNALLSGGAEQEEPAFLQKPYSPNDLARKVREVLDSRLSSPRRGARE
jgi:CheY-like chemotaxis protein